MRLVPLLFLLACGSSSVADDVGAEAGSDAKVDSNTNPCQGLGCASGPGRLMLHVVDSMLMKPVSMPTFTENGKPLAGNCTMGDAGTCGTWEFDGLSIGMHSILVHAQNALDQTIMVAISGPAGCCGMGPDVEKTVVLQALTPSSLCTSTGGTVGMNLCCQATSDFPDTCLVGACGCSPMNSKMVQVCNCGQGKCYDAKLGCK